MYVRKIFMFFLCFLSLSARASAHSIKGTVINETTKKPLEFVNVVVLKAADSSLVTGTVTDTKGVFEIHHVPDGSFVLWLSYIGYQEKRVGVFVLDAQHEEKNFGSLSLLETSVDMDEVTVTSQKILMNNAIDRKVYNVEQDVLSKSSSVSELLKNIPSVEVDIEGNVSLRGSSNVMILINGRTSPLMGKTQAVVLQQMPAASIEKVELITNPSAKYKPDGTSGIINIVLKKNIDLGINGSVSVNAGNADRANGNARLNYNPGNLNLYGSVSIRKDNRNRFNDGTESGIPPKEYFYSINMTSNARPLSHMIAVGLDYKLDKANTAGIAGNYFHNGFTRLDNTHNRTQNAGRIDTSVYNRNLHDDEYEDESEWSLFYEHAFPEKDHKLRADFRVSAQPEEENNKYTNPHIIPSIITTYDNMRFTKTERKKEISLEYSDPLTDKTKLESGYIGEFNSMDLDLTAEYYDAVQQAFVKDSTRSNKFLLDESIHALYGTLEHSFGQFGVMGGLRAEQVYLHANQITRDSLIKNEYFTLFPTLHLSYQFSEEVELQLNYSKRTRRPEAEDLNPFPEYRDQRNVSAGNARLLPENIHSVELGLKLQNDWATILPSLYYRYTYNRMTSVTKKLNDTVYLSTRENLSNDRSAGAELILSASVNSLFSANLSANVYYNEIDASNLGFSSSKSTVTWSSALTFNVHLSGSTMVQVNSNYNAARLTPQGETKPSGVVNIGFRQEFLDRSLSLVVTVADVFKTVRRESDISTVDYNGWSLSKRDSQVIYFGVTYTFGASPKKAKKDDALKYDNGL